jgi:hypothetical protein
VSPWEKADEVKKEGGGALVDSSSKNPAGSPANPLGDHGDRNMEILKVRTDLI